MIWVVGMANAINLIDGLDGLAAGIVAIAAGAFFLYALQLGHEGLLPAATSVPLVAVVALGVCLGFLPHNVHPARIFMGDGGALLLGLLMAASTMVVGGRTDRSFSGQSFFFFAPMFIPLVILGRADPRHAVRHRAAGPQPHRHRDRRQGPPAPPPDAARPRPPAQRVHPVGVDRAAVGLRAVPDYSGSGDGLVPIGIAAILLSLYMVLHPGLRRASGGEGDPGRRRAATPAAGRRPRWSAAASHDAAIAPVVAVARARLTAARAPAAGPRARVSPRRRICGPSGARLSLRTASQARDRGRVLGIPAAMSRPRHAPAGPERGHDRSFGGRFATARTDTSRCTAAPVATSWSSRPLLLALLGYCLDRWLGTAAAVHHRVRRRRPRRCRRQDLLHATGTRWTSTRRTDRGRR